MRICQYRPCEMYLPVRARANQKYCSDDCCRAAWLLRGKEWVAQRRSSKNRVEVGGRRQCMTEDALAQILRHAPKGATGYRLAIKLPQGEAFFPRPGAASHLSFEGFRRMGDAFAIVPEYEFPRVPFEDHFTVLYVGHGGREMASKGTIVVQLPGSAPEPSKAKKRMPLPPPEAPIGGAFVFPVEVLRAALGATAGNIAQAARMLGTQRSMLAWHLRKAGVAAAEFRRKSDQPGGV